jgi:uncharacterized membrane protein YqjE
MSWAHVHLALNHVPVIGLPIVVLLLLWGLGRRNAEVIRAAFGLLVLLALVTLVVQLTGEPAEELVEGLPGVVDSIVERHEEAALVATVGMSGLGLLALFGWLAASTWALALPGLALGAIVLFWGLVRLPGQKEVLAAYQILAPGTHPPEWQLVGSHTEVLGFIDGLRRDMQEIQAEKAATRN